MSVVSNKSKSFVPLDAYFLNNPSTKSMKLTMEFRLSHLSTQPNSGSINYIKNTNHLFSWTTKDYAMELYLQFNDSARLTKN